MVVVVILLQFEPFWIRKARRQLTPRQKVWTMVADLHTIVVRSFSMLLKAFCWKNICNFHCFFFFFGPGGREAVPFLFLCWRSAKACVYGQREKSTDDVFREVLQYERRITPYRLLMLERRNE